MIVGFTGTRENITSDQRDWLRSVFDGLNIERLHHGCCVGADLEAHVAAVERNIAITVHPPVNQRFIAAEPLKQGMPGVDIMLPKPYFPRNRDIAGACTGLIALPKQNRQPSEMHWGGTWYTVEYALRLNKPVMICYPDGRIERRSAQELKGKG